MRIMVALDDSEFAQSAVFTAISMIKTKDDHITLITVVDDIAVYNYYPHVPLSVYVNAQQKAKNHAKKLLQKNAHYCAEQNIYHDLMMGISNHVAEMLCQAVGKKM